MRAIILACLVLLASCGSVHKISTSNKKTVDSVATSTRDTSHMSHETTSSDNFSAKDVHIRVDYLTYQPGDTTHYETGQAVPWSPFYTQDTFKVYADDWPVGKKVQRFSDLIRQAIASSGGGGRIPSSIAIDIGSFQDSSSRSDKKDSGSGHATSTANVHTMEAHAAKEVTRTGIPLGAKVGIGFLILLILAYLVYRFKKNIFPL